VESETPAGESFETSDGGKTKDGKQQTRAVGRWLFRSHPRRVATFAIALAVVAVGAAGAFAADQVPFADQIPLVGSTASTDSPPALDTSAPTDSSASTSDAGTTPDTSTGSASSDTPSTDSGASSTSTASGTNADVAGRYIVTFASGVTEAEQAAAIADAGATDVSEIAPLRMHAIDASDTAAAALQANAAVIRVEADQVRDVQATPSDPEYPNQWSLPRIGWDQVYGNVSPAGTATVAVLDTGVDATHPDLGHVVPGTSVLDGSNGETDPNGHGTWMAGIVAAGTDNGTGIAGVGYAGVKVMPVTVLGADGTGIDSDVISGVVYAADHGADVILMAFSNPGYSASLQAAIDYAWSKGAVVVAATGNDGSSTATFPAGDRGVIGVSNTDFTDSLALSSNYGNDTFLAAPGEGIETTSASGGYATISGTSAAAAEVAGAAALMMAAARQRPPEPRASDVG
jgi:Subtilase family